MTNRMVWSVVMLACAAACVEPAAPAETEAQSTLTSTTGLDSPLLFDVQYYLSVNSDVAAAYGANPSGARTHWLQHGIYEGRRGSPVFDCNLYLALYSDLRAAFGTDCAAAMRHFQDTGLPAEGRRGSVEFDARYYLANNGDLLAAYGPNGFANAAAHYLTFGIFQEGRAGSNEFDIAYYICHTADLTSAYYGDNRGAAAHWVNNGIREGRRAAVHFDVTRYVANYADLAATFGSNYPAAMQHWLVNGIHEGRTGDPGDNGGAFPTCAAGTRVALRGTTTTSATGFPTTWFGVPLPAGQLSWVGLNGLVSLTNSQNIYSEVLFIVGYLPASSGACISGQWPASTPEFGPPGLQSLTNLIVKAPTAGTYTAHANFALPAGAPMQGCLMVGLNGGTVAGAHPVTSTSNLTVTYTGAAPTARVAGAGGEFCFGQSWGCQGATTNNALSFASIDRFAAPATLRALYGNISDSTFDGSSGFGALPTGAWTAKNDFYIYHSAACAALGSGTTASTYYNSIPNDAIHLLAVPISGNRIGGIAAPVYQAFDQPIAAGDCLVTLYGMTAAGGFDNETQVQALVQ